MISIPARCRLILTGLAATALFAAPVPAAATTVAATTAGAGAHGCAPTPLGQPFATWGDHAEYFPAPDGGFERGGSGWSLQGAAGVVAGSEPFRAGGLADDSSLRLAAGAAATTAAFCIGTADRTIRFFADADAAAARAAGSAATSALDVDVLYADAGGYSRSLRIGAVGGAGRWAPTDVLPMVVNALAAAHGDAMSVRLRFAPRGPRAWTIDDVFVDPYRSR